MPSIAKVVYSDFAFIATVITVFTLFNEGENKYNNFGSNPT